MNIEDKVRMLLQGKSENHMMPFFWQHGEDEAVLRHYMEKIQESGCMAVCVESRPHPDFCGPGWWRDMDVILDEARGRGMKVWILDDSHFPTGYANGAVRRAPLSLHRQSLCMNFFDTDSESGIVKKDISAMIPPEFRPMGVEPYMLSEILENAPHYEDDEILSVTAVNQLTGEEVALDGLVQKGILEWKKPAGIWKVWVAGLSRNCGPHRDYINMMSRDSCKILLDAVYEPHWEHYREDFGRTIAGFFSDEPELGNGHLYFMQNILGTDQDLPFSRELAEEIEKRLGEGWKSRLYLLWDNDADADDRAFFRYTYMDIVTRLVRENFSRQIGDWCRERGVRYIGHLIEDDNAHGRTGSSLGHYFRGLDGQDMSGIDDIGGQVLPQGEDGPDTGNLGVTRDGEFYHYMLGSLAASAAAIEPGKKGRAMCEIFGNYGWAEGVRLEKYLAEHFMVRGINYFVPHAFSPKAFPDMDCPPHFYAHGHNPQFRHFGALIRYMNRVCTLISDGKRMVQAAILYHGEAEWAGEAMLSQKPARKLAEAQIDFLCIPSDVFSEPQHYGTDLAEGLTVNGVAFRVLIIPYAQYLTEKTAEAIVRLQSQGFPVLFLERLPRGVCDGDGKLPREIGLCETVQLEDLAGMLEHLGISAVKLRDSNPYIRAMHYRNGWDLYYLVNEGEKVWRGKVEVESAGNCYYYDAWENRCLGAEAVPWGKGTAVSMTLEPMKGKLLIFGEAPESVGEDILPEGKRMELKEWKRSMCEGVCYPSFGEERQIVLPDHVEREFPDFSGFIRYRTCFAGRASQRAVLEITDAAEGVEVFCNGISLGIQVVPVYRYDLSSCLKEGENEVVIEVATTLERRCYQSMKSDPRAQRRGIREPVCMSGICGEVSLYLDGKSRD